MVYRSWLHRLITPVVARVARTGVTPNQLTTLRLFTGLGAAGMFALGEGSFAAIGGGLFVLSIVLDHADGVLARITNRTTRLGHIYDLCADAGVNALVFVGVGVGLRHGSLGVWALALGVVAGLAVAAIFVMVARLEARANRGPLDWGWAGIDPDHALFLVPVAAWAGGLTALLFAASVAAPIVLAAFAVWAFNETQMEDSRRDGS